MEKNATYLANEANVNLAKPVFEAIIEETKHPFEVNLNLLLEIIKENKDSEYGKKYHFEQIKTYQDFAKYVPVIEYKDIAMDVDRMANGEKNILTSYAFNHMNKTSGTVGKEKLIPMTNRQASAFLKYNKNYLDYFLYEKFKDKHFSGRTFYTSQGSMITLPSGITAGDASAVMAKTISGGREAFDSMLAVLYTSPIESVVPLPKTDNKYLMTRFALADKEVTGIIGAYSSSINQYLDYISQNYEMLIYDIEHGTINPDVQIPEESRLSLKKKLKPNKERADELKAIFKNGSNFQFIRAIWPNFVYILAVGGASFQVYTDNIKKRFADESVKFIYSGITASEGLFSIPFDVEKEDSVLAPGSVFYEFLPVEAGEDYSKIVTMDQLEVGKTYEIIITNASGFYRLKMSDCIKVTGYYNKTPTIIFMYRKSNIIDIAGEKTTEKAVFAAVKKVCQKLNIPFEDYTAYAYKDEFPGHYEILIQPEVEQNVPLAKVEEEMEIALGEANELYAHASDAGQIAKVVCYYLQPRTSFLYKDLQIYKGASASQFKPVHVIRKEEEKKFFYILRDIK